jgi:hypothetical protein
MLHRLFAITQASAKREQFIGNALDSSDSQYLVSQFMKNISIVVAANNTDM